MRPMWRLTLTIFALFICGCATTYNSPSSNEPNAIVRFQSLEGIDGALGTQAVYLIEINGKQPAFLRLNDTTRLAIGENTIVVKGIGKDNSQTYARLTWDVQPNENYMIKRVVGEDDMSFTVVDSNGKIVAHASGPKRPYSSDSGYIPYIPVYK